MYFKLKGKRTFIESILKATFNFRFEMHLLTVLTLFMSMSLIYAIKTQDECQIESLGTKKPKACNFEAEERHDIEKGCKRPNVRCKISVTLHSF